MRPDGALDPWVSGLNEAYADADDLLWAVATLPLVNEARLIEEFGYASLEEAREGLSAQVQYAYEKFDIQAPEDLHEWSALELAKELYGLLKNVYEPFYAGESSAENFEKAYEFMADPEFSNRSVYHPSEAIARLDGSHPSSPMNLVFFVASFFIEPLDWGLTAGEMVSAAEDEDWWEVFLLGATAPLPGGLGRAAKGLRKVDDAVDLARRGYRASASSGSNFVMHTDGPHI